MVDRDDRYIAIDRDHQAAQERPEDRVFQNMDTRICLDQACWLCHLGQITKTLAYSRGA